MSKTLAIIGSSSLVDYNLLTYIFDNIKLVDHEAIYITSDNNGVEKLAHLYLSLRGSQCIEVSADYKPNIYIEMARCADTVLYLKYSNDTCDLQPFVDRKIPIHELKIENFSKWYALTYNGKVEFVSKYIYNFL